MLPQRAQEMSSRFFPLLLDLSVIPAVELGDTKESSYSTDLMKEMCTEEGSPREHIVGVL